MRQRLRLRGSPQRFAGRALSAVLAAALVWYGAMILLLALRVGPDTINSLSGYRDAYDSLAGLQPNDITSQTRLILGLSGLTGLLLFGYLALKQVPRPYLARHGLQLGDEERGSLEVEPRAVERVAEIAAAEDRGLGSARARMVGGELELDLSARRARELGESLRAAQRRALAALERHELPVSRVNVTLTGYERSTRRELG